MNDLDALGPVREYDCSKSVAARDRWLSFRIAAGMPVTPVAGKFDSVPNEFAKQWAASQGKINHSGG